MKKYNFNLGKVSKKNKKIVEFSTKGLNPCEYRIWSSFLNYFPNNRMKSFPSPCFTFKLDLMWILILIINSKSFLHTLASTPSQTPLLISSPWPKQTELVLLLSLSLVMRGGRTFCRFYNFFTTFLQSTRRYKIYIFKQFLEKNCGFYSVMTF